MTTTAFCWLLLGASVALAQAVDATLPAVGPFLQYGAFGLLALIVVVFIWRVIPQHTASIERITERYASSVKELATQFITEQRDRQQFFFDQLHDDRRCITTAVDEQTKALESQLRTLTIAVNDSTDRADRPQRATDRRRAKRRARGRNQGR